MLVHVPEPRHLDTPFHSAAKMGSAQIIGVHSCLYLCYVFNCARHALMHASWLYRVCVYAIELCDLDLVYMNSIWSTCIL